MEPIVERALAILPRTPRLLQALLRDMPDELATTNEGPDTWSPFDVVGHMLHTEQTSWIQRAQVILEHGPARTFDPVDRFAQFEASRGKTLNALLDAFEAARADNLDALKKMSLTASHLARQGRHPQLGEVTLGQLIATWTTHDLNHTRQIVEVLARQRADAVGPWRAFLPILEPPPAQSAS